MMKWWKIKPEVEFQYGGRFFPNRKYKYREIDMSTKFGLLINFDLLKAVTSTNAKTEILVSCRGRHFEKSI